MLDLETLSTAPTAAILSIGAVCFDEDGIEPADAEDSFLVSVDPDYYDMQGSFDVDEGTKAWWAKQGKAARDALKINKVGTLPLAMDAFTEWCEKQEYDIVMAKPAHFDIPILSNAARHSYGKNDALPWKHYSVRCFRTVCGIYPEEERMARAKVMPQFVAHRADHDAVRQAIDYQYIMSKRYE
jgi:hypothetical protein